MPVSLAQAASAEGYVASEVASAAVCADSAGAAALVVVAAAAAVTVVPLLGAISRTKICMQTTLAQISSRVD